eukprot:SAG31_NODE_68_length_28153_cov_23.647717_4_plen_512_part_00
MCFDSAARTIQSNWKTHRQRRELLQFKRNITRIQRRLRAANGRLGVWAAQTKAGRATRLQRRFRQRRARRRLAASQVLQAGLRGRLVRRQLRSLRLDRRVLRRLWRTFSHSRAEQVVRGSGLSVIRAASALAQQQSEKKSEMNRHSELNVCAGPAIILNAAGRARLLQQLLCTEHLDLFKPNGWLAAAQDCLPLSFEQADDDAHGELDGPRALRAWLQSTLPRLLIPLGGPGAAAVAALRGGNIGGVVPGWLAPVERQLFLPAKLYELANRAADAARTRCLVATRRKLWAVRLVQRWCRTHLFPELARRLEARVAPVRAMRAMLIKRGQRLNRQLRAAALAERRRKRTMQAERLHRGVPLAILHHNQGAPTGLPPPPQFTPEYNMTDAVSVGKMVSVSAVPREFSRSLRRSLPSLTTADQRRPNPRDRRRPSLRPRSVTRQSTNPVKSTNPVQFFLDAIGQARHWPLLQKAGCTSFDLMSRTSVRMLVKQGVPRLDAQTMVQKWARVTDGM